MTAQELYDLSQAYLQGRDGIPKNEAKGYETMRQAAEAGHEQALKEYALYIAESEPQTAVRFIEQSATALSDNEYRTKYIRALYAMIGKNAAIAAENRKKAEGVFDEETADGDTCFYYGKILDASHAGDGKKYLTRAAILGTMRMSASDFSALGRQKGILTPDEFKTWAENYVKHGGIHGRKVYTVECAKNQGMAEVILNAQLDEQSVAQMLGKSRVKKMKKMSPKVVLEYQKLVEASVTIGNYPFSYKHKHSNTIDGTGNIEIDTPYSDYAATFKHRLKHDDLNSLINTYRYSTDSLPDNAQIRAYNDCDETLEREVRERIIKTQSAVENKKAVDLVLSRYNWMEKNTYVYFRSDGEYSPHKDYNAVFVPYWFFIYELKGETISVRIDGFTGEASFFVDNPFGQYLPTDDVKEGGCMTAPEAPVKFNIVAFVALAIIFPIAGGAVYILLHLMQKLKKKSNQKKVIR